MAIKVAALFVETDGCYFGVPDIDPWDINRDARDYRGPWPVVAHPPCQRWGRSRWGRSEQRLPVYAVERYGYEKARRIGVMAAVGGKDKTRVRNATPDPFRDILLTIARSLPALQEACAA